MFDLEQAIADWRRQMLAAGLKTPEVLDELESHLRDDVEQQERAGKNGQHAFEMAVQHLGQAALLECEFDKVGTNREAPERVKHAIFTLAGIPNHLTTSMNASSNVEPGWATYLKAGAFLVPALCLWALS